VPLASGTRIESFEIRELIGVGGMGEVYLAHDTKLNRRVAIKVLPDAYAADPDRIARFHREAQAVAALNHPGIAAIYDLAEADGRKFLVLELIEGETLAERLRRGQPPVEEALQIAKQIVDALEAAHERGVCHRDLKPANIKLTAEGSVKVLDFGLAKFLQSSAAAPHLTHSPTLSLAGTYPGVILGTAGYMSPEQAKGFEADQRSDIFSFGCILYELLTGKRAFEGDTASEILASVLKSDVDWSALPPRLNPRLVELLKRCLEKDPRKRWHAAADVRVEIEGVVGRGVIVDEPRAAAVARAPLWKRTLAIGVTGIVAAAVAGYAAWRLKPAPAAAVARFVIALPEGQNLTNVGRQALALSPDGTQLVYAAENRLLLRPVAALDARPIPGSDIPSGVVNPVFSPDGQSVAFRSNLDGTLKRLALSGGAPVTVCRMEQQPYGIAWHEDAIVFGQTGKGILSVSPDGGVPHVIAAVGADEIVDSPQLLPDRRGVLFSVRKSNEVWDQAQIVVQPLDGGARRTLIAGGADGRYLPTGHIAYALGGVVLVVRFDLETLSVVGGPVPLIEGVRRAANVPTGTAPGSALFAVSAAGTLTYVPGPATVTSGQTDLGIFDRKGNIEPLKLPPGSYRSPRVSRDGRWVAFETGADRNTFVSVYEIGGRSAARRLTFDASSSAPLWSIDGDWVVFTSDRDGGTAIYRTRADGSGTAERLTTAEKGMTQHAQAWSSDGTQLLFSVEAGSDVTQSELHLLNMRDRKATPLRIAAAREAAISPDGRWVAYGTRAAPGSQAVGNQASGNQVFVEPFPPTGAKYLLPQAGGHPAWMPKGDELLTNASPVLSQATPIITSPRFAFGQAIEFSRRARLETNPVAGRRQFDVLPDGRVIGVLSQGASAAPGGREIVVVLNWFHELRQRVPAR
jgi:eukaryotic-like serine/threonine-protein kinase